MMAARITTTNRVKAEHRSSIVWLPIAIGLTVAVTYVGLTFARSQLGLNINEFLSAISAVATGVAFLFGVYLAILAISAYGHIKGIESAAQESEQVLERMTDTATRCEGMQQQMTDTATRCEGMQQQITAASEAVSRQGDQLFQSLLRYLAVTPQIAGSTGHEADRLAEIRRALTRDRARLLLGDPGLAPQDRITHILTLRECRDEKALPILRGLRDDPEQPAEVVEAARRAVDEIEGRPS